MSAVLGAFGTAAYGITKQEENKLQKGGTRGARAVGEHTTTRVTTWVTARDATMTVEMVYRQQNTTQQGTTGGHACVSICLSCKEAHQLTSSTGQAERCARVAVLPVQHTQPAEEKDAERQGRVQRGRNNCRHSALRRRGKGEARKEGEVN